MEIDVLYRTDAEDYWQNINRFVRQDSIDLAIFSKPTDNFTTKKVIWNAASRLKSGGIFCIYSEPENISYIINLIKEKDFYYNVIYFQIDSDIYPFVVAYNEILFKPNLKILNNLNHFDELSYSLINLSNFGDIVLLVGNNIAELINTTKILNRQVIGFSNYTIDQTQGVKEVMI